MTFERSANGPRIRSAAFPGRIWVIKKIAAVTINTVMHAKPMRLSMNLPIGK
jgi:hypothetical protein